MKAITQCISFGAVLASTAALWLTAGCAVADASLPEEELAAISEDDALSAEQALGGGEVEAAPPEGSSSCSGIYWHVWRTPITSCGACGADKRHYREFAGWAEHYPCSPGSSSCCTRWLGTPSSYEYCDYC